MAAAVSGVEVDTVAAVSRVAVDTVAAVSGVAVDTVAASGEDMEAATSTVMAAIIISTMMTDTSTIGHMTTTTTVGIVTGGVGTVTADDANILAGHLSRQNAAINARNL